ncbi:MAG TPA: gamma-glutamyl-gamma-aminobutyrate hydrolase family protein [Chthoniobacteraceae bacterium]
MKSESPAPFTTIASWVREVDDTHFANVIGNRPGIRIDNARTDSVDLEAMNALLLTGGADISADFHREPPANLAQIQDPDPARDAWEFTALRRALDRGLPILCICKGVQVLNVALGGTLLLDILGHDLPELKAANLQPLRFSKQATHRFDLVNSSHHQAIGRLAEPLEIEAWCRTDDIVEQVRVRGYPWAIGVQFHPERDATYYRALFDDFIEAAMQQNHGTQPRSIAPVA